MARTVRLVAALTALVLVTSCGRGQQTAAEAQPNPGYAGPMTLQPDFSDDATAVERAGAAGLALQCGGALVADGGGGDYIDGGAEYVALSPERALEIYVRRGNFTGPDGPFVIERRESDRVLFSYRVEGKSKATLLARNGISDWKRNTGWGIESWGACDPTEWPADVTDGLGIQIWQRHGTRMSTSTISSFDGIRFCGWENVKFVTLGEFRVGHVFIRDPDGALPDLSRMPYDPTTVLPSSAVDTGFERDGRRLWLAADNSAAYLVGLDEPTDVERWPGLRELPVCY